VLSILVTTKPAFCRSAEALAARPVRLVELSTANEGPAGVPAPVGAAVTLGAGVQVGAGEADWLSARWMTLHHTKVVSRERTSREINAGIGRRDGVDATRSSPEGSGRWGRSGVSPTIGRSFPAELRLNVRSMRYRTSLAGSRSGICRHARSFDRNADAVQSRR